MGYSVVLGCHSEILLLHRMQSLSFKLFLGLMYVDAFLAVVCMYMLLQLDEYSQLYAVSIHVAEEVYSIVGK